MLVRRITEADVAGFHAALDAVARESGFLHSDAAPPLDAVADFVRGNIATDNPQFVAIDTAGQVVGWCDIFRSRGHFDSHVGALGMGVVAAFRGRGLGKRLLAETVAAADALGLLRIELSVHADNPAAIELYLGSGFSEEGRKRGARIKNGGRVDVLMMARLRPEPFWGLDPTSWG